MRIVLSRPSYRIHFFVHKLSRYSFLRSFGRIYVVRTMRIINEDRNVRCNTSGAILNFEDGIMIRNTQALAEMELICVKSLELKANWDLADSFFRFFDPNCVWDVVNRWKNASEMGDAEGYVAHFILHRHRNT